jgi:hypothetical protein
MSNIEQSKYEDSLKSLSKSIQDLALNQSQMSNTINSLQELLNLQKMQVDASTNALGKEMLDVATSLENLRKQFKHQIKRIEDIPCVKHPKWYEIQIPYEPIYSEFDAATEKVELQELSGYVNINPEGPFVITQITPLWEITDTEVTTTIDGVTSRYERFANPNSPSGVALANLSAPTGRILPCTSFDFLVNSLGKANTEAAGLGYGLPSMPDLFDRFAASNGVLLDVPEFQFQIEIGGSGRFWTNNYVPAHAFYGVKGAPLYLGTPGWVKGGDRVILHARTSSPIFYKGKIRFIMHGYQMLGKIDIAKALGY